MFGRDDRRLATLRDELSPIVRRIGKEEKLTTVDLQEEPALANPALYPDQVHLDETGATIVAERVRNALGQLPCSACSRPVQVTAANIDHAPPH
jgi:hypothetical protein